MATDAEIAGSTSAVREEQAPFSRQDETTLPQYFPFPFAPYDIQEDFMKELYRVLDKGGVGIFESPTGTGKSLSLICGALTWLRDFEASRSEDLSKAVSQAEKPKGIEEPKEEKTSGDSGLPSWVIEYGEKKAKQEKEHKMKEEQEKLAKQKLHLEKVKTASRPSYILAGKRKHCEDNGGLESVEHDAETKINHEIDELLGKSKEADPDADIIVAEYHSDDEADDKESMKEEDEIHCTKIYYCSRTHSQLAQFTREVQKSPFGETTRLVTLGSRQNLCINPDVKKLKTISRINDRCLELHKNKKESTESKKGKEGKVTKKKKTTAGCQFRDFKGLQTFRDRVLVEVKDIEQLVSLGEELHACPYYGTRVGIPAAQIVCLPYNLLLHKSTREACGIKLDGNVVVIDEAHNLLETINSIHSVEITGSQILCSFSQLSQYLERYKSRLKAKNLMYIKQLLFVLSRLITCLGGKPTINYKSSNKENELDDKTKSTKDVKLKSINDFLFLAQMDNINLFKVCKYCERSMISKKLNGFVDKYQAEIASTNTDGKEGEEFYQSFTSPMRFIENFLEALTNADENGRVVINKQDRSSTSSVKFLLLNPAVHFTSVVKEARAVIVAGGTMQPTSEFKDQLFACAGISTAQVREFSCGHVIPPENLLVVALDKGPSGTSLDFTYQARDSPQLIEECGRLLINTCAVIPGGVVCFFPSFDYAQKVYNHWQQKGILERLNSRKKVYQEPRQANQVEQVLSSYCAAIKNSNSLSTQVPKPSYNGAILLCVVGGKMSEGINFSDDMGRCVVMVGLPYPNINSPELKEKMNYLNSTVGARAGQAHYENLCMKAVNQSIGRAIRHRLDYASILLLDQRYSTPRVSGKLPSWISSRLQHHGRFGPAFAALRKFFVDKRSSGVISSPL